MIAKQIKFKIAKVAQKTKLAMALQKGGRCKKNRGHFIVFLFVFDRKIG